MTEQSTKVEKQESLEARLKKYEKILIEKLTKATKAV